MKLFILLWIFLSVSLKAQTVEEIVSFRLDPQAVHTIYCHERNTGVTTVVFPAEISGIYAAKVDVKFNKKEPNPFLLSFTQGNSYFTVKSLSSNNAEGAINVVFEKKVFVLHLKTVKKGHSSVTFLKPKQVKSADSFTQNKAGNSAALLLSMLDKAKAFHLIKKHYPAQTEGITYAAPSTVMHYSTHQILLREVIRFDSEDTVYFQVQIKNKSLRELRYNPTDFAVNVSDKIFYSALADASGKVPAEGVTTAWFCISGTKSGGRNNLAVKNDWKILLNVSQMPQLINKKPAAPLKQEEDKTKTIKTLKDVKLEEVKP